MPPFTASRCCHPRPTRRTPDHYPPLLPQHRPAASWTAHVKCPRPSLLGSSAMSSRKALSIRPFESHRLFRLRVTALRWRVPQLPGCSPAWVQLMLLARCSRMSVLTVSIKMAHRRAAPRPRTSSRRTGCDAQDTHLPTTHHHTPITPVSLAKRSSMDRDDLRGDSPASQTTGSTSVPMCMMACRPAKRMCKSKVSK